MKSAGFKVLFLLIVLGGCSPVPPSAAAQEVIRPGADQPEKYLPLLKRKKVALVVNQTSRARDMHLVDFLLKEKVQVKAIFAPEHGFRGTGDAGARVKSGRDKKTNLPIYSLYGKQKKPAPEQLDKIDMVIFDIQDVGVRFFTYISTMHYVMEACAEQGIPLLILDRPNPNGDYVAGPVREPRYQSFVGMHPIPIVHGCTVGELAQMINGEGWLSEGITCSLQVIPVQNYTHQDRYELPVRPSPNLPTYQSVRLYPSLCLFEGTPMSVGRGTYMPFEVVGYPDPAFGTFTFTPKSIPGMATSPVYERQTCFGKDFRTLEPPPRFTLDFVRDMLNLWKGPEPFFTDYFNLLAGTRQLKYQLQADLENDEIALSWAEDLLHYKALRKKYLIYPDFE